MFHHGAKHLFSWDSKLLFFCCLSYLLFFLLLPFVVGSCFGEEGKHFSDKTNKKIPGKQAWAMKIVRFSRRNYLLDRCRSLARFFGFVAVETFSQQNGIIIASEGKAVNMAWRAGQLAWGQFNFHSSGNVTTLKFSSLPLRFLSLSLSTC